MWWRNKVCAILLKIEKTTHSISAYTLYMLCIKIDYSIYNTYRNILFITDMIIYICFCAKNLQAYPAYAYLKF